MKVLFAGDTHGNENEIRRLVPFAKNNGANVVVVLGDFGYWPDTSFGEHFLNVCSELALVTGLPIYWVDGNHEDFRSLYGHHLRDHDEPVTIRTGVYWLPRGVRLNWKGVTFLAMGGAASIDRGMRTEGVSWFPEEMIDEHDLAKVTKADVVLAHDSPLNPLDAYGRNFKADVDSEENRRMMRSVVNIAQPDLLLHGHYHMFHDTEYLREGGYTRVVGLNKDEGRNNCIFMDLKDGKWSLSSPKSTLVDYDPIYRDPWHGLDNSG